MTEKRMYEINYDNPYKKARIGFKSNEVLSTVNNVIKIREGKKIEFINENIDIYIDEILNSLKENKINALSLINCDLKSETIIKLMKVLETNTGLHTLNLKDNIIRNNGISNVLEMLQNNRYLKNITLDLELPLKNKGTIDKISKTIERKNFCITEFNVRGFEATPDKKGYTAKSLNILEAKIQDICTRNNKNEFKFINKILRIIQNPQHKIIMSKVEADLFVNSKDLIIENLLNYIDPKDIKIQKALEKIENFVNTNYLFFNLICKSQSFPGLNVELTDKIASYVNGSFVEQIKEQREGYIEANQRKNNPSNVKKNLFRSSFRIF